MQKVASILPDNWFDALMEQPGFDHTPQPIDSPMEELLVKIHARNDKRGELLQTCQYITERTLQIHGCMSSSLYRNSERANLISLEQKWERRSLLNDYFGSKHFTALLGAMKWLGKSFEIQINGDTHEESMKTIQLQRMA